MIPAMGERGQKRGPGLVWRELAPGLAGDQQAHKRHGANNQRDYHDGVESAEFALVFSRNWGDARTDQPTASVSFIDSFLHRSLASISRAKSESADGASSTSRANGNRGSKACWLRDLRQ